MRNVYKPEHIIRKVERVFLGGTIDMGNSEDWQKEITEFLLSINPELVIYNPRRDDWDSSWKQEIEDPQFNHQVTWELTCLEKADLVIMYYGKDSKSPISLLETGLFKDKIVCYCPDGFYRKGNVDIVADRYGFPVFKDWHDFRFELVNRLADRI
ncbi:MAG: hypothetical protein GY827_04840 [Cytophagales bacterium]|nr:hypothetical protein [Cytophagales bacterium]